MREKRTAKTHCQSENLRHISSSACGAHAHGTASGESRAMPWMRGMTPRITGVAAELVCGGRGRGRGDPRVCAHKMGESIF